MMRYSTNASIKIKTNDINSCKIYETHAKKKPLEEVSNTCHVLMHKLSNSMELHSSKSVGCSIDISCTNQNYSRLSNCIQSEFEESRREENSRNNENNVREVTSKSTVCKTLTKSHDNRKDDDVEEPYRKYVEILQCSEYIKDIFQHLREIEDQFVIRKDFLRGMKITPLMRAIFINWMIDVQVTMEISNESLHLSVYLVDCYLSCNKDTTKDDLQLLGIACLFLAGKYDEVRPIPLRSFMLICEDHIDKKDVLKMEVKVLKSAGMRMTKPSYMCFLRRCSIIAEFDKLHHTLSKFFVDASLIHYPLCLQKSSLIAAASTFITLCLRGKKSTFSWWNNKLSHYTRYDFQDLAPVLRQLVQFLIDLRDRKHSKAVLDKYSRPSLLNVNQIFYEETNLNIMKKLLSMLQNNRINNIRTLR